MNSNEYMRQYMLKRYHERRAMALQILGNSCRTCGATEDLEIDHAKREEKSFNLSSAWSISLDRFLAELSKCQLLCAAHHKSKTRSETSVEHGGGKSGKKNCKCSPCRERKNEYMRSYKMGR